MESPAPELTELVQQPAMTLNPPFVESAAETQTKESENSPAVCPVWNIFGQAEPPREFSTLGQMGL